MFLYSKCHNVEKQMFCISNIYAGLNLKIIFFFFRFLYLPPEEIDAFAAAHKHTPLKKQVIKKNL